MYDKTKQAFFVLLQWLTVHRIEINKLQNVHYETIHNFWFDCNNNTQQGGVMEPGGILLLGNASVLCNTKI